MAPPARRDGRGRSAAAPAPLAHLPAEQLYRIADFLTLPDVLRLTLGLGKRGGAALRAALAEVTELRRTARTRNSTPPQLYARWAALPQPLMGALATLSQEMLLPVVLGAAMSGSALALSRFETLALRHAVASTNAGERALRARQTARDCRDRLAMIQRCIDGDTGLSAAWRRVGGDEVFGKLLAETLSDVTLRSKLLGVYSTVLERSGLSFKRREPAEIDRAACVWLGRHSAHPVEVFGATAFCSASMAFSHLILGGVAARTPSGEFALRVGDSCDIARILERVLDHPFDRMPGAPLPDWAGPSGLGTARRQPSRKRAAAPAELGLDEPDAGACYAAQCDRCAARGADTAFCRVCQYTLCGACAPASGRHVCDPKCDVSSDASVTETLAHRVMTFAALMQSQDVEAIMDGERLAVNRALISSAQAQRNWLASVEDGRADADRALAKSSEAHAAYVRDTYGIADPFQTMAPTPGSAAAPGGRAR